MAKAPAGSVCLNHPNTHAVTRCATCSKPICQECIVKHGGVSYCSTLCRDNAVRTGAMVDDVQKRKGAANFKRFVIRFVQLLILLAVLGAAYWYYKNNKSKVDSKLQQGIQKVEQGKQELMDKGHNVIKDSQYKKDRENLVK